MTARPEVKLLLIITLVASGGLCLTSCMPDLPTPDIQPSLVVPSDQATDTTSTHIMLDDQGTISCGINLCADAGLASVVITTTGNQVDAALCLSQEINFSDEEAMTTCTGMSGTQYERWVWHGVRTGDTATVTPTTYSTPYLWAVVSFTSDAPDATPVSFVGADHCQRLDGSFGVETQYGECLDG